MLRPSKKDHFLNGVWSVSTSSLSFLSMNLKTGAAPRMLFRIFICIVVLKSCGVGASALCRAEEHPSGTTSYVLDESVQKCKEYSWLVDGVVVAHEENFNQSLVYKRQFQNITLTACHRNVTHKNACTMVLTNCSYNCLEISPIKGRYGSAVASVVGAILVLVILFVALCNWRKLKRWFQCRRGTYQNPPLQNGGEDAQ